MKIARFEPFPYVDLLNRSTAGNPSKQTNAEWQPAVDVLEDKGRFLLRADVPGVSPGDIDVSMDAGVLTISGARISEKNDDATDSQRIERSTGRFLHPCGKYGMEPVAFSLLSAHGGFFIVSCLAYDSAT